MESVTGEKGAEACFEIQGSQTAHFEGLAPEILLTIVTQLPDLQTLGSLLRASPSTFRLFEEYGADIFESVLSSGYLGAVQVQELIRVVTLIRSSALPIHSVNEFKARFVSASMKPWIRRDLPDSFVPPTLSRTTKPAVLRSIVATAGRVSSLTHACLQHYLVRVRAITPERLVDQSFTYPVALVGADGQAALAWEQNPKGERYVPHDIGPPSWIEEQRVARAFWCLQVFDELKKGAAESSLTWPKEDIERIRCMQPIWLYEILSDRSNMWLEEIVSAIEFLEEVPKKGASANGSSQLASSKTQELKQNRHTPIFRERDWERLLIPTPGVRIGQDLWSDFAISFDSFRRLGFALWDHERMAALGLVDPKWVHKNFNQTWHQYYFSWRSLLSEDEQAQVERTINEREAEERMETEAWLRAHAA